MGVLEQGKLETLLPLKEVTGRPQVKWIDRIKEKIEKVEGVMCVINREC